MEFAQGKIVMALEGGYNLDSTAKSSLACVQVLLEDKPIQGSCEAMPFMSTWRVIQAVCMALYHPYSAYVTCRQRSYVSSGFRYARGCVLIGLHLQMNYHQILLIRKLLLQLCTFLFHLATFSSQSLNLISQHLLLYVHS